MPLQPSAFLLHRGCCERQNMSKNAFQGAMLSAADSSNGASIPSTPVASCFAQMSTSAFPKHSLPFQEHLSNFAHDASDFWEMQYSSLLDSAQVLVLPQASYDQYAVFPWNLMYWLAGITAIGGVLVLHLHGSTKHHLAEHHEGLSPSFKQSGWVPLSHASQVEPTLGGYLPI